MASTSLYIPDELAADLARFGIDRAKVCIAALRAEVERRQQAAALAMIMADPAAPELSGAEILDALDEVRSEGAEA